MLSLPCWFVKIPRLSVIFSYRVTPDINEGLLTKLPLELPRYVVDFQDGIPSGVTISTASTGALNVNGNFATPYAVGTTAISGTTVAQTLLTCGSSGTAAAVNGARFKVTTTATLSNAEVLLWNTYVFISEGATYDPGS